MTSASSLVRDVSIPQDVIRAKGRACAAELTVASSFACHACVLLTALKSAAVSLQAAVGRTYFQEALKASEMLEGYETVPVCCAAFSHFNRFLFFLPVYR